jgi:hypothetical protein
MFSERGLLTNLGCGFFDHRGNVLWSGYVNCMAGAGDLDLVAFRPIGVPALEVRIDGPVFPRYQHPAWFTSPSRSSDDRLETVGKV